MSKTELLMTPLAQTCSFHCLPSLVTIYLKTYFIFDLTLSLPANPITLTFKIYEIFLLFFFSLLPPQESNHRLLPGLPQYSCNWSLCFAFTLAFSLFKIQGSFKNLGHHPVALLKTLLTVRRMDSNVSMASKALYHLDLSTFPYPLSLFLVLYSSAAD